MGTTLVAATSPTMNHLLIATLFAFVALAASLDGFARAWAQHAPYYRKEIEAAREADLAYGSLAWSVRKANDRAAAFGGGIRQPTYPGHNGGSIRQPIYPGHNGGGIRQPIYPGHNWGGVRQPIYPGHIGGGIRQPSCPGCNGGGIRQPTYPGHNGGGIRQPNRSSRL